MPLLISVVPSTGSTATSTSGPVPSPTSSPLNSIGALSFSPSPITTTPRIWIELISLRMASTAAPSPPSLSPRPTQRPAAIAAASVTRTRSRAMLRSRSCGFCATGMGASSRRCGCGAQILTRGYARSPVSATWLTMVGWLPLKQHRHPKQPPSPSPSASAAAGPRATWRCRSASCCCRSCCCWSSTGWCWTATNRSASTPSRRSSRRAAPPSSRWSCRRAWATTGTR